MRAATFRLITTAPRMHEPGEVLAALHAIARKNHPPLSLFSTWYLPQGVSARYSPLHPGQTTFFGPDVDGTRFWKKYLENFTAYGGSALNDYGRNTTYPFTLTEALHVLRLSGNGRWIFGLLRRHGAADGLYCPYRRWIVLYGCNQSLDRLDDTDRQILFLAGAIATGRLGRLLINRGAPTKGNKPILTARQLEVLRLRATGKTAAEIAEILDIAPHTARNHLARIIKRLKAADVVDAVVRGMRQGLLLGLSR